MRNLSTLIAACIGCHPEVSVLNHGAWNYLGNRERDFLQQVDRETLGRFCRAALVHARGGRRGSYGGSILFSHAFDRPAMRQAWEALRSGPSVAPRCLVWKESMRVSNHIARAGTIEAIVRHLPQVRFLCPIRNPLQCAASNMRTEKAKLLVGGLWGTPQYKNDPFPVVLAAVMGLHLWFLKLERRHPHRFLHFFEDEVRHGPALERIRRLLGLSPMPTWSAEVRKAWLLKSERTPTTFPAHHLAFYRRLVNQSFSGQLRERFLRFSDPAESDQVDQRPRVFGVGWHKTGTTTLFACLEQLGYDVQEGSLPLLEWTRTGRVDEVLAIAERFQGLVDWPWPLLFRQLDERFPGSKFVLTLRKDSAVWLKSLLAHAQRTGPTRFRELVYGQASPAGHEEAHVRAYQNHNREVLEYFKDRPDDLLVVCWEDGDGWDELTGFLGHEAPDVAFPHLNRRPS